LHFANRELTGFGSIIINNFGFLHYDSVLLAGAVGGGVLFNCITVDMLDAILNNDRPWLAMACEIPVVLVAYLVMGFLR
jgi:hypothetical protein